METYTLTAKLGTTKRRTTVTGSHENMDRKLWPLFVGEDATEMDVADADASMSAMPIILRKAYKDPVWAQGEIVLAHSSGRVVRTMEAKS